MTVLARAIGYKRISVRVAAGSATADFAGDRQPEPPGPAIAQVVEDVWRLGVRDARVADVFDELVEGLVLRVDVSAIPQRRRAAARRH